MGKSKHSLKVNILVETITQEKIYDLIDKGYKLTNWRWKKYIDTKSGQVSVGWTAYIQPPLKEKELKEPTTKKLAK